METITLILAIGALCVVCFVVGAKVGQKVSKGEPIEMPNLNPIEAIRERQHEKEAKREAERQQDELVTLMENIENYNGTSAGQKDFRRG